MGLGAAISTVLFVSPHSSPVRNRLHAELRSSIGPWMLGTASGRRQTEAVAEAFPRRLAATTTTSAPPGSSCRGTDCLLRRLRGLDMLLCARPNYACLIDRIFFDMKKDTAFFGLARGKLDQRDYVRICQSESRPFSQYRSSCAGNGRIAEWLWSAVIFAGLRLA